jgi:hypothetical protein
LRRVLRALAVAWLAVVAAGCSGVALAPEGPSLPQALLGPEAGTILVEVGAVAGHLPSMEALDHVKATLANVTGKQVSVTGPSPVPEQGGDYHEDDLRRIHEATGFFAGAGGYLDGDRVVLHVLYLDGRMADDDKDHRTLGRSLVDLGLVVIFRDTYANAYRTGPNGLVSAAGEMDSHVLLHEVGHALGLVGNGIPMVRDHDSAGHPGHSRYPESVMYFHPPMTPDQHVSGVVATTFDVDDLADLAAYRARLVRPMA